MRKFESMQLPVKRTAIAPDGSDVRVLLGLEGGGMAHFELGPGESSTAVAHKTVEEIWYVLSGRGEMWRKLGDQNDVEPLEPGVCLTIPVGTHFQFRCIGEKPLKVLGATMPPWPGEDEAYGVEGKWERTVGGMKCSAVVLLDTFRGCLGEGLLARKRIDLQTQPG